MDVSRFWSCCWSVSAVYIIVNCKVSKHNITITIFEALLGSIWSFVVCPIVIWPWRCYWYFVHVQGTKLSILSTEGFFVYSCGLYTLVIHSCGLFNSIWNIPSASSNSSESLSLVLFLKMGLIKGWHSNRIN